VTPAITRKGEQSDYRWMLCRCARCGAEHQCSPFSDFYPISETDDRLICERCLLRVHNPKCPIREWGAK
jgi:hypothetical protein